MLVTINANLNKALSLAQSKIKGAVKDSANLFFKSKYADLTSVWEACQGPLTSNGLSIVQYPFHRDYGWVLITVLLHESGEFIQGEFPIFFGDKLDAQKFGAAVTYARRFALQAMVGVCPHDDDGNEASTTTKEWHPKQHPLEQHASSALSLNQQDHASAQQFDKTRELAITLSLSKEADMTPEEVKTLIKDTFKVNASSALSLDQCKQLNNLLKTIVANRRPFPFEEGALERPSFALDKNRK